MKETEWPREQKWRHLYSRNLKVTRSQQLSFDYPSLTEKELLETETLNVLFVCTMNKWRSLTAEKIYKKHSLLNVRSVGTSSKARRKVSVNDIRWADVIIYMEDKHAQRIETHFQREVEYVEQYVIDVEDRFRFMDPRLIEELQDNIDPILLVQN